MTSISVGTGKIPFSADRFPVTPDTMGSWDTFPSELLANIFRYFSDLDLAKTSLVNWTCKESVERNTSWGERKRFFRIFHLLVQQGPWRDFPFEAGTFREQNRYPVWNRIQDGKKHCSSGLEHWANYFIAPLNNGTIEVNFHLNFIEGTITKTTKSGTQKAKPTWMADSRAGFQGVTEKWVVLSSTDKSNTKGALHFLDQETLIEEFSYDFYASHQTPLPPFEKGYVYKNDKFCIVLSPHCSIIKMDGTTVRIAQEIMQPLHGFTHMTNFSCLKQPDGQMEIIIEGEKMNEKGCIQHTADPFSLSQQRLYQQLTFPILQLSISSF